MNFPFYIARRYFFTRKLRNAINIISMVSIIGVTVGTTALVVILSVFNGFEEVLESTYSRFDPDLKITPRKGKTFVPGNNRVFQKIQQMEEVAVYSPVLEENALIQYDEKQYIGRVKGVESNYVKLSNLDSSIVDGRYALTDNDRQFAIVGRGVAIRLSMSLNYMEPLVLYVPEREQTAMLNPAEAFSRKYIFASGIFSTHMEYDMEYVIVPMQFARELLDYDKEITGIEIRIAPGFSMHKTQERLEELLGEEFVVKNRFQQQEAMYKVMKSEKLSSFLILKFILIIATATDR